MNVIFHTATAIGISALLTDTKRLEQTNSSKTFFLIALITFVVGVISHGALDYIPHCYPINSKFDTIISSTIILLLTWLAKKKYRIIIGFAFLGSIFPDLVDLSFPILNKQFGLNLPIFEKIFPWHWHDYSGSIYSEQCKVSTLNHFLLLLTIALICWCRGTDLKTIFEKTDRKNCH